MTGKNESHRYSMQKKLFSVMLILCFAATFIQFIASAIHSSNLLKNNIHYSAQQALQQANKLLSFRMNTVKQTAKIFCYSDTDMAYLLSEDPQSLTLQQSSVNLKTLQMILLRIVTSYSITITNASIYVNDGFIFASQSSSIRPFSMIENTQWYQRMVDNGIYYYIIPPQHNFSKDTVSVIHLISSPYDYSLVVGALILDTDASYVQEIINNCIVTPNSICTLTEENGDAVFSSAVTPEVVKGDSLYTANAPDCGWVMNLYVPSKDVSSIRFSSVQFYLAIASLIFSFCIFLSKRTASFFTRRINILAQLMQRDSLQHSIPLVELPVYDEIDQLTIHFQGFLKEIDRLKKEEQEQLQRLNQAELDLLHSQINPHFLFNMLDTISLLMQRNELAKAEIAVTSLSGFYKTNLVDGKQLSTLEMELLHIKNYMAMQALRYGDYISLEIYVPEGLMKTRLPRVTLQPLIENALIHGFLDTDLQDGHIIVSAQSDGKETEIHIRDNGIGIPTKQIPKLLDKSEPGGFGLKNVHERICLYFGKQYGLRISSVESEYTLITIRLPSTNSLEQEEFK